MAAMITRIAMNTEVMNNMIHHMEHTNNIVKRHTRHTRHTSVNQTVNSSIAEMLSVLLVCSSMCKSFIYNTWNSE